MRQLGVRKRVSDRSGKPEVFGLCADGLVTDSATPCGWLCVGKGGTPKRN